MNLSNPKYLMIYTVSFIILALSACGGAEDNKDDIKELDTAHYTDAPPEGEMGRALHLLEGAQYPFHAVRAKPLPEFAELEGLQTWNAYAADDFDIRVYVLLFANQAEGLAAMEILEETGDEQGLYRRMGVNGALLFVIEMDEEPSRQDEERWVVSDYLSALAGEE